MSRIPTDNNIKIEGQFLTQTVRPKYLNCSTGHEDENTLITMIMITSMYYAL